MEKSPQLEEQKQKMLMVDTETENFEQEHKELANQLTASLDNCIDELDLLNNTFKPPNNSSILQTNKEEHHATEQQFQYDVEMRDILAQADEVLMRSQKIEESIKQDDPYQNGNEKTMSFNFKEKQNHKPPLEQNLNNEDIERDPQEQEKGNCQPDIHDEALSEEKPDFHQTSNSQDELNSTKRNSSSDGQSNGGGANRTKLTRSREGERGLFQSISNAPECQADQSQEDWRPKPLRQLLSSMSGQMKQPQQRPQALIKQQQINNIVWQRKSELNLIQEAYGQKFYEKLIIEDEPYRSCIMKNDSLSSPKHICILFNVEELFMEDSWTSINQIDVFLTAKYDFGFINFQQIVLMNALSDLSPE